MRNNRNQLVGDYAQHYRRINYTLDVCKRSRAEIGMMDRTFGAVLRAAPQGARILDLGCGVGFLLHWLSRFSGITAIGVDASVTQLEIARHNLPDLEIVCADGLEYLHNHENSFDGIFCTDVLEHIPGIDLCIEWVRAAKASLRSGGFFVCRCPNAANLTNGFCRYIDLTHERSFTEKSILQLLNAGGFEDARVLPIRAGSFSGLTRQLIERNLHRLIYGICGQRGIQEFAYNVCAVGYRRD